MYILSYACAMHNTNAQRPYIPNLCYKKSNWNFRKSEQQKMITRSHLTSNAYSCGKRECCMLVVIRPATGSPDFLPKNAWNEQDELNSYFISRKNVITKIFSGIPVSKFTSCDNKFHHRKLHHRKFTPRTSTNVNLASAKDEDILLF